MLKYICIGRKLISIGRYIYSTTFLHDDVKLDFDTLRVVHAIGSMLTLMVTNDLSLVP